MSIAVKQIRFSVILNVAMMILCLHACTEKPYEEYKELNLNQCLTPAQLTHKVNGVAAEFSWTLGKDAQAYNLVIASDRDFQTIVGTYVVDPEELPYKVELASGTYYYKVQASSDEKNPSFWAVYEKSIHIEKIIPIVDLSALNANCYIVSEAGKYKFKPTKGSTSTPVEGITAVSILWETSTKDESENLEPNSVIAEVTYSDGYIHFATPETFCPGNVLIAAKNDQDKILWSWHIWLISEKMVDVEVGEITLMDRNLGELSASARTSMLYQWGRKDPFPGSFGNMKKVAVAGIKTTAEGTPIQVYEEKPTVLSGNIGNTGASHIHSSMASLDLWGKDSEKTINDPCPAGYKVPYAGQDQTNDLSKTPFAALSGLKFNSGVFELGTATFGSTGCYLLNTTESHTASSDLLIEENTCYLWTASRNANRQGGGIRISVDTVVEAEYWIRTSDSEAQYQAKNNAFAVRCQKIQ